MLGPAALTSFETSALYFLKASANIFASLILAASKPLPSFHALAGLSTSPGTSGIDVGIERLKTPKFSNSTFSSEPSWIESMIFRVILSGHRFPTPNCPPVLHGDQRID